MPPTGQDGAPSESATAQVWPLRGRDTRSRETTFFLHVRSGWGELPGRGREQSQGEAEGLSRVSSRRFSWATFLQWPFL